MTAPEPTLTAEHIDAVARSITVTSRDGNGRRVVSKDASLSVARLQARTLLASTDPAVHTAMLDALVRAGHPVGDVIKAWEVAGRAPTYHRSMKAQLRKAWPTLHSALQRLSRVAP